MTFEPSEPEVAGPKCIRVGVGAWGESFFFCVVLSTLLIFVQWRSFAHDPYEISSTIRIESNRTTVEVEMEFNTAMTLIGVPRSRERVDQGALFQSKLAELRQQAARFFEVASGSEALTATGTNVTLGVENHVKFDLEFPPTQTGLKLNATGLKSLGEQGPFGVGLTVLDLVNMKVLGQSTLFAANPVAEFASIVPATNAASFRSTGNAPTVSQPAPTQLPSTQPKPGKASDSFWGFVILMLFGAVLLVLIRRWRSAGGSQ